MQTASKYECYMLHITYNTGIESLQNRLFFASIEVTCIADEPHGVI